MRRRIPKPWKIHKFRSRMTLRDASAEGMRSAFDLSGSFSRHLPPPPENSVQEALAEDAKAIGLDLQRAVKAVKQSDRKRISK